MESELIKSISSTDAAGKKVRYGVEEIENGWILTQDTEWKDAKGNYQYKCVKKFYTENPLDEKAIKVDIGVMKNALGEPSED